MAKSKAAILGCYTDYCSDRNVGVTFTPSILHDITISGQTLYIIQVRGTMKKTSLYLPVVFLLFINVGFCNELRKIKLQDGNVINGNILSLKDGVYSIKTTSLGTIKVKESEIDEIVKAEKTSFSSENDLLETLDSLQKMMMDDKKTMKLIESMQGDSNVQQILNNPELLKAVSSLDVETLMGNEEIINLTTNPTVQEIKSKITGKKAQGKSKK